MDATSREFVQGLRNHNAATEADLDVDGLSESLLSRLIKLFSPTRR